MLIGYGQPAGIVPTMTGAAGINLPALLDGAPASIARISGGAGSASLRLDWAGATPVRIVAALGLTCPAGTALTLTGKRASDPGYDYTLGGNAATQTVVQLPDGSRAAWYVLPAGNTPLVGLQLVVGAGAFDIGELTVLQAVDVALDKGWSMEEIDPSMSDRTLGGQLNVVERRSYRRLVGQMSLSPISAVRGAGLANGMDWEKLAAALRGNRRGAVVHRWQQGDGAINAAELHRCAIYGRGSLGAAKHASGPYSARPLVFEEVPPV